jgi:hypothetical protein
MNGDHPVNECSNDPERNLRQEALMIVNNRVRTCALAWVQCFKADAGLATIGLIGKVGV